MRKKRQFIILGILSLLFIISITLSFIDRDNNINISTTAGMAPIASITVLLALSAALIAFYNPYSPVTNIVNCLRDKYDRDKRQKYIKPYLSNTFINSGKYNVLIDLSINPKGFKMNAKQVSNTKTMVTIELKNKKRYIFELIPRDKSTDTEGVSKWVVNDVIGEEFES
jgi:hypothetical protein